VHQLVVHQRVHAFAGREGLVDEADRRGVHQQRVARHCAGRRIAVVAEVLEQDRDLAVGIEAEVRALGGEGVGEGPRCVWSEVRKRGIEVDQPELPGLEAGEAGRGGAVACAGRDRQDRSNDHQLPGTAPCPHALLLVLVVGSWIE
jgi:hypothetical protein